MNIVATNLDDSFYTYLRNNKYKELPIPEVIDLVGLDRGGNYHVRFSDYPATGKWISQLAKLHPDTNFIVSSERKTKIDGFKHQEWKKKDSPAIIFRRALKMNYLERYETILQHAECLSSFYWCLKNQGPTENLEWLIKLSDFERVMYVIDKKLVLAELCFLMEELK